LHVAQGIDVRGVLRLGSPQGPQHPDTTIEGGRTEFSQGRGPEAQRSHAGTKGIAREMRRF